jgi:23S rRNA (adenine2503-C2)-methyltransferase
LSFLMNRNPLDKQNKIDLKNLTLEELTQFLAGMGKERFRAGQLMRWIYGRGVVSFAEMTDLSKSLREELAERAFISDWTAETTEASSDGTKKYLFRLADGQTVETVRIPMEGERATLCISTQVGCAMQCSFCLTGTFGLVRNLESSEIVNQVCAALKDGPINNIVLMGMGEPLHNLDNVVKALQILYAPEGFDFSPRKITLSTSGLVPEMLELGRRIRVNLASLPQCHHRCGPRRADADQPPLPPPGVDGGLPAISAVAAAAHHLRIHSDPRCQRQPDRRQAAGQAAARHPGQGQPYSFQRTRGVGLPLPAAREHRGLPDLSARPRHCGDSRASKGQDISAACGQLKGSWSGSRGGCRHRKIRELVTRNW